MVILALTSWMKKMHWHGFNLHISTTSETNWHVFHGLKWSEISLQTALSMLWSCLPLVDKIPSPKTWGLWGRFETVTHTPHHTHTQWRRMRRRGRNFQQTYQFHANSHWNAGLGPSRSHKFFSLSLFLSLTLYIFYIFIFSMDLVTGPVLPNDLLALWCHTGLGSWEDSEVSVCYEIVHNIMAFVIIDSIMKSKKQRTGLKSERFVVN